MKRALEFVPVPALLFAGAIAARVWLAYAPQRIAIDRAQPLVVVTAWGAYGAGAFAILAATIALATFAALAATLRARDAPREITRSQFVAIALASVLACMAWPFVFSSDVYAYAAYGDLAMRGLDPYVTVPAATHDAIVDFARWQWGGVFPPCVYGPAFVWFARAVVTIAIAAHADASAVLWIFRALAALAYLATIACACVVFPLRTVALGALNPVVVWSVAEGHNDIFALLALAAILALTRRATDVRRYAALPVAMVVKASVGIAAIAMSLDTILIERRSPARVGLAAAFGFVIAAVIVLRPLLHAIRPATVHAQAMPLGAIGIALAIVLATIGYIAFARGHRSGHAWFGLAIYAALPNPYPWYAVVLVAFALAGNRSRASISLYAVTILALVRYLGDAFGNMTPVASLAMSATLLVPVLFALTGLPADLARSQKEHRTP